MSLLQTLLHPRRARSTLDEAPHPARSDGHVQAGGAECPHCAPSGRGDGDLDAGAGAPVIAVVGAPNVGKSTLFNVLTGASRRVGNWPGTTVEVGSGVWRLAGTPLTLLDLPGAYSLDPFSPDEELTRRLLVEVPAAERPDLIVVVVDAAHLARSLYLPAQLRETDSRVVIALTMNDVAERRGMELDLDRLSTAAGCPVVLTDPRSGRGADRLAEVVRSTLAGPRFTPRLAPAPPSCCTHHATGGDDVDAGRDEAETELAVADERFDWVETVMTSTVRRGHQDVTTWSDRIDRVVTAPIVGPVIFLGVMWLVFQATTTLAAPLQGGLDWFFSTPVSTGAGWLLSLVGLGGTWVEGLVVSGLIAGVGMLLTFVPLMAVMFLLLSVLENCGYLSRAAVCTDRAMRMMGLPGRAFLPFIVGFGCNVPAISATRILPDARSRLLTVLLVPFTSCSARLTVFVLLASVFFPDHAGTVVFAMYVTSVLLLVFVGLLLRRTLWRGLGEDPLVLDLPAYQVPTVRLVAAETWLRLRGFVRTASGIIVATVIVVWLLQSIPAGAGEFGQVAVEDSVYAALASLLAPVFAWAGFGSWQAVSALVVGFVAKEAVISSWAQTFATADPSSGADGTALSAHLEATFQAASGGHPLPAVLAFMVFLLAYTPCVATLATQFREVGGRWTLFGVVLQLVVAWTLAVLVFQVGRVFW